MTIAGRQHKRLKRPKRQSPKGIRPLKLVALVVLMVTLLGVLMVTLLGVFQPTFATAQATPDEHSEYSLRVSRRGPRVFVLALGGLELADIDAEILEMPFFQRDVTAAALSMRAAHRSMSLAVYATLGAGNRTTGPDGGGANTHSSDELTVVENGLSVLISEHEAGEVSVLGMPALVRIQRELLHGAKPGSFGDALGANGVTSGLVSGATFDGTTSASAASLAIANSSGAIDEGIIHGLTEADPSSPFGLKVNLDVFLESTHKVGELADVIFVEPGELERAERLSRLASKDAADEARSAAIRSSFQVADGIASMLRNEDRLLVVGVDGPPAPLIGPGSQPPVDDVEYLTKGARLGVFMALGQGFRRGEYVTSPSTRRDGLVTVNDIAPTVLSYFDIARPELMTGRPIAGSGRLAPGGVTEQVVAAFERNSRAVFRDDIALGFTYSLVALIILMAIGAFWIFLGNDRKYFLHGTYVTALMVLAFPTAALFVRFLDVRQFGLVGGYVVLVLTLITLTSLALVTFRPHSRGAILLLLLLVAVQFVDLVTGSRLQANSVFGNSDIVGGRFYGIGNAGFALLAASVLCGFGALANFKNSKQGPVWFGLVLVTTVVVLGLPAWGSDVGGVLTSVVAFALVWLMSRGHRIVARHVAWASLLSVVVFAALGAVDYSRSEESRTHLGRFFGSLVSGEFESVSKMLERKFVQSITTLGFTRWAWAIVAAVAVVSLLLRPNGVLRGVVGRKPVLFASLWGCVIVGSVGFAVNDSGIVIPSMVMAVMVPFIVVLAIDEISNGFPGAPLGDTSSGLQALTDDA